MSRSASNDRCRPLRQSGLAGAGLACALLLACGAPPQDAPPTGVPPTGVPAAGVPAAETPPAPAGEEIFVERAAELGLDFVHFNGMTGELHYLEVIGGGGALFDYDRDGDLDLYLTQGHLLGHGKTLDDALFPPRHPLPLSDRLYRNDLDPEAGAASLRFTDVTVESGLAGATGYGMGAGVGDYDNDGWPDLYVTNWGPNQLWRNRGRSANGSRGDVPITFEEVTDRAGVEDRLWSIPAVFFDYDRDGWLDLYVGNYLDYNLGVHKECINAFGQREYCGPASFPAELDRLFRNAGPRNRGRGDGRGDGPPDVTFEDVTPAAGLHSVGPGMGAVSGDFDGNGWLDLYVANDEYPNLLLLNQGDGTFRDEALLAGCALNAKGHAEAGMGVDANDFDGDGDEDLLITHLTDETNTLYLNDGAGNFDDRSIETGLGSPSFAFTGFGTGFVDYDNDGLSDLLVVNGAVQRIREQVLADDPLPLHQRNLLFRNFGGGRFDDVSDRAGAAFELSEVSRGAVFGDVDNDGDIDVVIHNNAGPARLLVNQVGAASAWLGLRLVGGEPPRDMLGAWVELARDGRPSLWRRVKTEGSFASAHDPRLLFGLGSDESEPVTVRVTWPDGSAEEWRDPPRRAYTTLKQGTGQPVRKGR